MEQMKTERKRRISAKMRVLELLQCFTTRTNIQLNDVCFRYGARIYELRKEGYRIDRKHKGKGVYEYHYRGHSMNYELPLS